MNLIVDVRMVNEHLHGIGRYTYELVSGLNKKNDINLKLLTNNIEESKKIFSNLNNSVQYIKMKSKFLNPMEIFELPIVLNKYKDCIFHSPSFSSSPFIKIKSYITIHDLNHLALPQYYSKIKQYYYKFAVKPFAKKCEKIFTVSEFSKKEIIKWLKCNENKVVVTYNGIDEKFKRVEENNILDSCKKKYHLPDKFVLYIGNLKPHKNVETLIKAMKFVNDEYKLVINGSPNESISNVINEYDVSRKIKFIGYVDEEDLPTLYSLAKVFVFPSLYEGFGLPPLEAISCGCPTIVSNTTSLPEVVGEAAIIIKPYDYITISKNINKLASGNFIKSHKDILLCKSKYSWQKCIDSTYKELFH